MKTCLKLLSFFVLFLGCCVVQAQDAQFSQFYNNPLYHNPAFAGHNAAPRFISNFRQQWLGLGNVYRTTTASVDSYIDRYGIGWGIQAGYDEQGNNYQSTFGSVLGSYWIGNELWGITFGLKGSLVSRGFNAQGLKFIDQYTSTGINPTSIDPLAGANRLNQLYPDFTFGLLYESHRQDGTSVFNTNRQGLQMGAVIHHFDKSFNGQDFSVPLPMLAAHVSYKLPLPLGYYDEQESSLVLMSYVRKQGVNATLDFGGTIRYAPLSLGLFYRGLPLNKYNTTAQQDALVAVLGYENEKFKIGASYDMTVTSLSWKTGGTLELSLWLGLGLIDFRGSKSNTRRDPSCEKYRLYKPW